MKKIFSLLAAVLFAGSMMADPIVINASDVTTIASGATSGLDVTLQGINIVWQGAYYNSDGSDGGSASVDFRVYANKSMTLTAESNISKVEIAGYCKAGLTVTANAGTITTGASYASETTKGTLEDPLIVVDEIGATSVTLTCTKQMRAYTIRVTLGEGGVVEPGDGPVAEAVLFKAENVEADAETSVVAASAVLVDDAVLKVVNVYESFVSGTSHTYEATPEHSIEFKKALQVRASSYPAGEDLIGENNNTASTADNKKASPLVLTAKEDVEVVFYYRRQSSNTVYEVEGDKNSPIVSVKHEQNDSKDLIVYDQADIATQMLAENYALIDAANEEYAFAVKQISFKKGHVYTLTAKGTTLPLFGFEYAAAGSEESVVDTVNLGAKTIAEFLALKNTKDTCILTGVVSNIVNTTYGNFDLTDETGKVYVYGLLTPAGESKKFADLNVAENDTLTILAVYNEYNGNAQAKNAIFVEVKKSAAPVVEPVNLGAKTIAEFLELKNTKDTCILTGVVSNIVNTTYGNFDLIDATDTVYVYGLLTPAGESKKFAELGVAEGDKLTVKAIYNEYNGKPQAKNAIFVKVEKAQGIENIVLTEKVEKVLVDGVIYIVRDGKMFNLQGAQVR